MKMSVATFILVGILMWWLMHTDNSTGSRATPPREHSSPAVEVKVAVPTTATSTATITSATPTTTPTAHTKVPAQIPPPDPIKSATSTPPTSGEIQVVRITYPYNEPALSPEMVNLHARGATVNILCIAGGNEFAPVSGSGVAIADNVILTNAHVGQYVLLQDYSPIDISCLVRTGSPAAVIGRAHVTFISSPWISQHAQDIVKENPTGTGKNDVAILTIEPSANAVGTPPSPITFDSREAIAFQGDTVTIASYPAGFLGGLTIERSLALVSTVASVGELYSFEGNAIDMFSVGGTIVAQGGSSGSAVVNGWGKLVGIITTSSTGKTTSERDLRAITLAHVDRVVRAETGSPLEYLVAHAKEYASLHQNTLKQEADQLTNVILR